MAFKVTNKHNLPDSFVNAVMVDDHVSLGDISVTQLIDAPQVRMLKKTNDYSLDVMDFIAMMLGTGLHTILERGDMKGTFDARILQRASGILKSKGEDKAAAYMLKFIKENLEEDISNDVMVENTLTTEVLGWTISGTYDRYTVSEKKLEDYKTATASALMFPETKSSWNAQQNIYAFLLRSNGLEVDSARIIAVLKDWSKMKIMQNKDYPRTPVVMHDIELLDNDRVEKYIESRVKLHQRAENGEHIPCTPKDRWSKADVFKVKKKGGKRSLRNCNTEAMAQSFIDKNEFKYKPGDLWIDLVKGEPFRCANGYCPVSDVCPQYQDELKQAAAEGEEM